MSARDPRLASTSCCAAIDPVAKKSDVSQLTPGGVEPSPPRNDHIYFALWPDPATRERIANVADAVQRTSGVRGNRTQPDRYHLTLNYLGEHPGFPEQLVSAAYSAAEQIDVERFDIVLDRAGSFANHEIPCWLGPSVPPVALQHLHDRLATSLFNAGIRVQRQRNLVPHVTILRQAKAELPKTPIAPIAWSVDEFVLIHNHLGVPRKYTVLRSWPLRGARAAPV
jgi:RNA 2',3'-cyclic 3'-phosphodiesterase